ncbi:MAG: glucuronate isomerase [Chloroflexota bacterium]|nr:glucuronate isomerase [Chloroflexota bacterium]
MVPLHPDRYFSPDPATRSIAHQLYQSVRDLPLVCPHGHVEPRLFSDPDYTFGSPVDLLIIPDHYIFRMLYSRGILLEFLGIPTQDGVPVETDHRKIWQTFAEHFYLFRGTPTGIWLTDELERVFGITEKLDGTSAQGIYSHIASMLASSDMRPRALYERFNIEVLCTTDAATDDLGHHQSVRDHWHGRILPTFRPDAVINLDSGEWRKEMRRLSTMTKLDIHDYAHFIHALEIRRTVFKRMGAVATDHAALTAYTEHLSDHEADKLFQAALRGSLTSHDVQRFTGHMLIEMARMSREDGLVMQLHIGSYRNHNSAVFARFGRDKGADIPIATEFTQGIKPLLNAHGSDPNLTIILFTLDETTYARELAPLAGHYPALRIGPPWWFHDSLNGMRRYFDQVIETAGLYNTAGFNDDTRAFLSIPARHDVWRRASCDWLAGLVVRHIVDETDALAMARTCAYDLAKETYKL